MKTKYIEIASNNGIQNLEYELINRENTDSPAIIFLHEGLGSLAMWKGFPRMLCEQYSLRGLIYSRAGYGKSTKNPDDETYGIEYMNDEAAIILPAIMREIGIEKSKLWLLGHSDGASITLIYAAMFPGSVAGIIAMAPHIFVEDISISGIEIARETYLHGDLKRRLAKYHDNPDLVFWRWNRIWLAPEFRAWNIEALLSKISCPVMAIQGEDDEYGSVAQIDGIRRHVPQAVSLMIPGCGHAPHKDRSEAVIKAIGDFIACQNS